MSPRLFEPRSLSKTDAETGFMGSSLDLRAGLEVRLVGLSQLPLELLREFARLRACWDGEALRA
jgi:hypothetical protein